MGIQTKSFWGADRAMHKVSLANAEAIPGVDFYRQNLDQGFN
jgi:hypothetical protein